MAYEWAVFATLTAVVVSVVGLLATALFQQGSKIDRLSDRMERLTDRIGRRFDTVDLRMREDKVELLGRMDVLAERIAHLESS